MGQEYPAYSWLLPLRGLVKSKARWFSSSHISIMKKWVLIPRLGTQTPAVPWNHRAGTQRLMSTPPHTWAPCRQGHHGALAQVYSWMWALLGKPNPTVKWDLDSQSVIGSASQSGMMLSFTKERKQVGRFTWGLSGNAYFSQTKRARVGGLSSWKLQSGLLGITWLAYYAQGVVGLQWYYLGEHQLFWSWQKALCPEKICILSEKVTPTL